MIAFGRLDFFAGLWRKASNSRPIANIFYRAWTEKINRIKLAFPRSLGIIHTSFFYGFKSMRSKILFCTLFFMIAFKGFAETFVEGKDYITLNQPSSADKSQPVQVMEFFSYGCPWCARLDPELNKWATQKGTLVSLQKTPVIFNKDWAVYAKAFYTVQAFKPSDQSNATLFKAIVADKKTLNTSAAMVQFLTEMGIDKASAESAFNHSPSMDIKINQSKKLMMNYQIKAVPAVVVQEEYKTDLQMAGSTERFFKILDYLVEKAKSAKS